MKIVDVSIIIINWNAGEPMRDCLRSFCELTHDILVEVLVDDDASSDC